MVSIPTAEGNTFLDSQSLIKYLLGIYVLHKLPLRHLNSVKNICNKTIHLLMEEPNLKSSRYFSFLGNMTEI